MRDGEALEVRRVRRDGKWRGGRGGRRGCGKGYEGGKKKKKVREG